MQVQWQFLQSFLKELNECDLISCFGGGAVCIAGVRIEETETQMRVRVKLPDTTLENLEVLVTPETLFICGEQIERVERRGTYEFLYPFEPFHSLIPIPQAVFPESAIALMDNDELLVVMDKVAKPRKVTRVGVVRGCECRELSAVAG